MKSIFALLIENKKLPLQRKEGTVSALRSLGALARQKRARKKKPKKEAS